MAVTYDYIRRLSEQKDDNMLTVIYFNSWNILFESIY